MALGGVAAAVPFGGVAPRRRIGDTRAMARGAALTGSLVVHAIAFAAIAALAAHRPSLSTNRSAGPRANSVAIEPTAPPTASGPPTPEAVSRPPEAVSRPPEAVSRPPMAASRLPMAASRLPMPMPMPMPIPTPRPTPTPRPEPTLTPGPPAAGAIETTLQIEPGGGVSGAMGAAPASAGGSSSGGGNGIGFGAGGGIASPVDTARLATPEPPKPSLARPPRLIWPVRQGEIGEQPLYVAHITVDTDGYVATARLVQGTSAPRGLGAADAIWRFRYDPALDDDGHPVTAAIDQPFLLR